MNVNLKTVEGEAFRSNGVLVVSNIMIENLTDGEIDLLAGRYIRVTGYVETKHPWMIIGSRVIKKQFFSVPSMTNVLSVEFVVEK